ncbi:type II secretion system F family protein [Sphingomicrobium lutaoense]|uniref:Tight adherence protein C n=1 Tax=Sphingomicrobium lutaoense TaxID=515949 RepID=A0A839Z2H9_9SPHN|nr:type II secretion system F family protein [Sphingomicrobium lutaoense]MBB3763963.1 tight adherence protein C [Sphingomicrobium lutaoense]
MEAMTHPFIIQTLAALAGNPTLLGVDVILVATILSAVAALAVLTAIYAATTVKDPMAKRVKALNARREQLKAGIVASTNKRKKLNHQNQAADRVRSILSQFRMLQEDQIKVTQEKLMQAGIRSKELAYFIIFARFVLPVVLGLTAVVVVYLVDYFPEWGWIKKYGVTAFTILGAYKAPDIWLKNKISKRSDAIRKGLPDALDLLVICAEAGLTVDAAFNRVSKELGRAYPELGDEFGLTAIELGFLAERRQAFEHLARRVDLEAIRGVVTTMIQTEKYGTPLASALRVLSAEFRNERMMRAEEKAARLPAIMTIPLILFILPVLFIVILGPAACAISDNFINR